MLCKFSSNYTFYSLAVTILTKRREGIQLYHFSLARCPPLMATLTETHGNDLPGFLQFFGQLFMAYSLSVLFPFNQFFFFLWDDYGQIGGKMCYSILGGDEYSNCATNVTHQSTVLYLGILNPNGWRRQNPVNIITDES